MGTPELDGVGVTDRFGDNAARVEEDGEDGGGRGIVLERVGVLGVRFGEPVDILWLRCSGQ